MMKSSAAINSISIIIPTFNRPVDLAETIDSILIQTVLPNEILIVGESSDLGTEAIVKSFASKFQSKSIDIIYILNSRQGGLTAARNMGVARSKGDVILFLDDDVILDKDFISGILNVYALYPNAKGVQGYWGDIINQSVSYKIVNGVNRSFLLFNTQRDKCAVMCSFNQIYPHPLTKIIECQWLSGCNHSYIRSIFDEFKYDEKLIRYALGEDLDFSYRIYKEYPNSLYITPHAKLFHKSAQVSKVLIKQLSYIRAIYSRYIFYKNIDISMKSRVCFLWSRIGIIIKYIFIIFIILLLPSKGSMPILLEELNCQLRAEIFAEDKIRVIRNGDISSLNEYILK